jgi:type I restriction enzyme S subunit
VETPSFSGICSTDIFPLKPNSPITKDFLVSILRSKNFVDYSNTNAVGANLPRANKDIILKYKTILPDNNSLDSYSKAVSNIELQKVIIEKSICESEFLFQSLLQKAFTGELIHD